MTMRLIDADKLMIDMMDRGVDHIQTDDFREINQIVDEQPMVQSCEDCISRQAVINTIFYKADNNCDVVLSTDLMDRIKHLPSVTPKKKTGKWKVYEYDHFFDYNKTESKILMCSECETQFVSNKEQFIEWANYNIHYCPNCGAKMEVEE